jgi:DNA-binding response OmpR family regulator
LREVKCVVAEPKRKILVVDDERDFREGLADFLEMHGFTAVTAADGEKARAYLTDGNVPDLIVLDLKMPNTDGWSLYVWLMNSALAHVPVVMVSGLTMGGGLVEKMNRAGPVWLSKPVDPHEILAAVHERLSRV